MNNVSLVGRLTKDVEARYTQGDTPMCIARYGLAVDRRYKRDGEPTADFLNIVAFGKAGEFAEKYFKKGMKVAITGRIQTGSYEKDGHKVYTTDIVAENQEFCESKGEKTETTNDGFMDISPTDAEELPFL